MSSELNDYDEDYDYNNANDYMIIIIIIVISVNFFFIFVYERRKFMMGILSPLFHLKPLTILLKNICILNR